jgi:anti-sigma factor RsiW
MTERRSIGDLELCAYLDGELEGAARAEIESWLTAHPDDAARIATWRRHKDALAQLSAEVLNEAVPASLLRAAKGRRPVARYWQRAAAAILLVIAGAAGGWLGHGALRPAAMTTATADFIRNALGAHVVFAPEVRHPVEVWANKDEAHLVQWLSKRLGYECKPPPLNELGFRLVGGRLIADAGDPAAQYMYQDAGGRRITLYIRRSADRGTTAFRFADEGKLSAFYWIDGPLAYAIVGEMPRDDLLKLARVVYDELDRDH